VLLVVLVLPLVALSTACMGTVDDSVSADAGGPAPAVELEGGLDGDPNEPDGGTERGVVSDPADPGDPLGSGEPVTIAFAGDVSFEGLDGALRDDPGGLLSAIAPVLGAADISMVNLEAAVTEGGERAGKTFAFRVPPVALDALAAAGTDVVTMANNHGMDFGAAGLADSLRVREESQLAVIGIGADAADAYSPYLTEVRGQRVGIIAANDVFDSSVVSSWTATDEQPGIASAKEGHQDRLLEAVRALRTSVDTLAVYLHFGVEKDTCPTPRQVELVDLLVDAGADIVVGSHSHRLQGLGYRGDRFVAYGLSNFVFKAPSEPGRRSGVVTVTATGRRIDGFDWAPAVIQGLVPVPLQGHAADAARADMDGLRGCAGLSETPATAPEPR
jgi:poly-gamma-glutamate capsule biosynthesis protein CapA/YwtB (metallophosphatase superfamily)